MRKQNNIIFTNIPECFNITIIQGTKVLHNFKDHFHNSYNLGVLTDGQASFKLDDMEEKIKRNTIYFVNPKTIHSMECINEKSYSYVVVSITGEFLNQIFNEEIVIFSDKFLESPKKSENVLECVYKILNKNSSQIEKQELLIDILEQFDFQCDKEEITKKQKIENAIIYIGKHFKTEMELSQLANISYMSLFHFIREFRKEVGLSPFEYIMQLRIKEAQRLLIKGNKIGEVANEIGFYDQSHLSKYFKKHVGISPGEYISSYKEN